MRPRKRRRPQPQPASAVSPEMLALYRQAARPPTLAEELRELWILDADLQALLALGDQVHALGAGLQLVDVALRVAATPSSAAKLRRHKVEFFEEHFASLVHSFSHGHVVRIANAAVAMEMVLPTDEPQVRR